jgi:hypothetical protein
LEAEKMRIFYAFMFFAVVLLLAGCAKETSDSGSKADLTAVLEKSTIKNGGTTSIVMTAKNTGDNAIVAFFDVVPEDSNLVKVTYESRKDFTLGPGESITRRYSIEGHTNIRASEVLLSINLTSPGIGQYVSLGHSQAILRIEK